MSAIWNTYRIEDIADKITIGPFGSRMKSDTYVESGVPVIRGTNLTGSKKFSGDWVFITEKLAKQLENCCVSNGDLVFPHRGSIGEVGLVDNQFPQYMMSSSLMKLRCNPNIADSEFIYYFFKSHQGRYELLKNASQVGTPGIGQPLTSLKNIEIKLPSLREQRKIVKILSDLDEKIHLNNQINQTLESIAQALFKSWFIDFDPVRAKIAAKQEGKDPELAAMCAISGKSETELEQMAKDDFAELQATAALFPAELMESELGKVPNGWEITRFSNIVEKYIDNRGKTPPIQSEGIPLLEVKHLPEFSLNPDLNTDKKVSLETFNTWFRAHLQENDLIMSTVGTIGRLCIVPANRTLAIAQNILGLRFKLNKVTPLFMYYQMNSAKFRNDVDARLVITVQSSIKRKDLETIDLLQPDINIQNIFAEKIKPFVLSQQSDESLKLINIRDALLPKLLSGEVEVENL